MKLSIIMPVYNTKDYLQYSLGSIVSQNIDFNEVEVIVINDGSTDGSDSILNSYAQKYPFIRVYHQKNKGEAISRNRAIALAKGKYIGFVDSDDAIYENTLKDIIQYLYHKELDILYLNIHIFDEDGQFLKSTDHVGKENIVKIGLEHERRTYTATIYSAHIVKQILYPDNVMIGLDSVFNTKAHFFAKRVSYWSIPYYKYTQRANSLSKQGRSERAFEGFKNAILDIRKFEKEHSKVTVLEKKYFEKIYCVFITRILELNILPNLDRVKYLQLVQILSEEGLTHLLKQQDEKYPYFSSNFSNFKRYQNWLKLKSNLYKFFFRK